MTTDPQVCTFAIDDQWFGVPITDVQEVMRAQPMTKVPRAPPAISGLIHLRGQIVTAVDLRIRLGMPPRADTADRLNVLVRDGEGVVSLVVDRIGDVLELPGQTFERTPDAVASVFGDVVTGIYKLKDTLLLMLDVRQVSIPRAPLDLPSSTPRA